MADLLEIYNRVDDLVERNFDCVVPEARIFSHIIIQALKKKDVKWLRGKTAAYYFKLLGFDSVEFMDMAEPLLDQFAKKQQNMSRADLSKWENLRARKEEIWDYYLEIKSWYKTGLKFDVSHVWLQKLFSDRESIPRIGRKRVKTGNWSMKDHV